MDNKKEELERLYKDFGSRNVSGFKGIEDVANELAFLNDMEVYDTIEFFILKILLKIDKEEKHLKDNQQLIKRSFYNEGYYNGRISALEDTLDILIDVVKNRKQ